MASQWKGHAAGYAPKPSVDRKKKAEVSFKCDDGDGGKGVPWKGKPSPDGAKPSERKAVINPGSISNVKDMRKSNMGSAPKG